MQGLHRASSTARVGGRTAGTGTDARIGCVESVGARIRGRRRTDAASNSRMRRRFVRRARGIALLVVLVVLVLIATLATEIAITAKMHHTLAQHSMDDLLLRTAVDGRISILEAALRYDGTNGSGYDGEADEW